MAETYMEAKTQLDEAISELGRLILAELNSCPWRPILTSLSRLLSGGKVEW